jgi:2',3'-cyclic-nucleotide 2'-phosphodiesterase (5'-nucleotidase family)
MAFTLQILHASDFEGGIPAIEDAVRFSAVLNRLRTDPSLPANVRNNTLTLSSGDNYIPGAFLNASSDLSLNGKGGLGNATALSVVIGRGDVGILNALGIQASALGNHEFDLGVRQVRDVLRNSNTTGGGSPGLNFPYLSANLDFAPEVAAGTSVAASDLATNQNTAEASTIRGKLAKSTVITLPGNDGVAGNADDQKIGIVGATTPTLATISSTGSVGILPSNPTDYDALAAEIQKSVDILKAQNINKIVLLAHMQQLTIERDELARRLRDVDIIIAGGSNTLLSDSNDILRTADTSKGEYPVVRTAADGKPVLVVNTDANYKYVGRLVAEFDDSGVLDVSKLNTTINGAYATDEAGVDRVYGADVNPRDRADANIVAITDGIRDVIASKDNTIFGRTTVFLNGTRNDVRTQETNFGNLTADANLALARQVDSTVTVSIKNGGGIRDNVGAIAATAGGVSADDFDKLPPQPNPIAPNKRTGDISQLDIENSLRFNNTLSLLTVSAQELYQLMEYGVADTRTGNTPGRFPQVGGMSFSFDPARTAIAFDTAGNVTTPGQRIRSLAIRDQNDRVVDEVVRNGQLVGDPNRNIRLVTLNFLAGNGTAAQAVFGGDGYPFPKFGENRVDLLQAGVRTGNATFADNGTEQDALAEYLRSNFQTTTYNINDVGAAQDGRIQDLSKRSDGVFAAAGLSKNATNNLFNFTNILSPLNLEVSLTSKEARNVNEIGVFVVDDEQGRVNGIAPGQAGYFRQALGRANVVFSILPDGSNFTRLLNFGSGDQKLMFYMVQNGTTDTALANARDGKAVGNVLLGTSDKLRVTDAGSGAFNLNWEDGTDNDFNDAVIKIQSTRTNLPQRVGQEREELLDLRFVGDSRANFVVTSDAAFNNTVGFYRVADFDGGIDVDGNGIVDLRPGDANYAKTAIEKNVTNFGRTGSSGINLTGGQLYAPFLIANATVADYLAKNPNNQAGGAVQAYFAYLGANPDKVDHIRRLGDTSFGFEDLAVNSDFDFNDMVVQVNFS